MIATICGQPLLSRTAAPSLEKSLDEREKCENDDGDRSTGNRKRVRAEPGCHSDRGVDPDRGSRGQTLDVLSAVQNRPGAEKPDPGDNMRRDAIG